MKRLDQERQQRLEPKRLEYTLAQLQEMDIEIVDYNKTTIFFKFKGEKCTFFPYSGWHTGKTIQDGRGWSKLRKQLLQS